MRPLLAISLLTVKAAVRFRLFVALAALLIALVSALPFLIEHNGTARMFTQVLLSYSLTIVTVVLGLATIWLSCGTMSRDIGDCQMQMVAVKPIARWQIWLGKWVGIMIINAVLLALAGSVLVVMLGWQARSLNTEQQEILRKEVLVARGSVKEKTPYTEEDIQSRIETLKKMPSKAGVSPSILREEAVEFVRKSNELVVPGRLMIWKIDLSNVPEEVREKPLHIRAKFYALGFERSVTNFAVATDWQLGGANAGKVWRHNPPMTPDSYNEFEAPAGLIDPDGILRIEFANHNPHSMIFPLGQGLEVLYPRSNFGMNFARGLVIILCWLAVLTALGLCAASFLSFPIASFFVFTMLLVVFSGNLIANVAQEGTIGGVDHETQEKEFTTLDWLLVPIYKVAFYAVTAIRSVSPVASLTEGRMITWNQMGVAVGAVVFMIGGTISLIGMYVFSRRELAAAQSNQ